MNTKQIIFTTNKRNNPAAICDGYRYNYVRNNVSGNSFWRCSNREECYASITLNAEKTEVVRRSLHLCRRDRDMQKNFFVDAAKRKYVKFPERKKDEPNSDTDSDYSDIKSDTDDDDVNDEADETKKP